MAARDEITWQEAPNLAVPMHAASSNARAGKKRAEAAHGKRHLLHAVAEGQRLMRNILEKMMTPKVTQFILIESGGKVSWRIAPTAALESEDIQARGSQTFGDYRARP